MRPVRPTTKGKLTYRGVNGANAIQAADTKYSMSIQMRLHSFAAYTRGIELRPNKWSTPQAAKKHPLIKIANAKKSVVFMNSSLWYLSRILS